MRSQCKGAVMYTCTATPEVTMYSCSDVHVYRYINIMMVRYSDITVHSNTKSWWKDVVMYTCTAILVTVGRCDVHVYRQTLRWRRQYRNADFA